MLTASVPLSRNTHKQRTRRAAHRMGAVWLQDAQQRALERTYPNLRNAALLQEYQQVQDDLEAFLNPPCGVFLGEQFWNTVRHLEHRLDDLEAQLLQQAS